MHCPLFLNFNKKIIFAGKFDAQMSFINKKQTDIFQQNNTHCFLNYFTVFGENGILKELLNFEK